MASLMPLSLLITLKLISCDKECSNGPKVFWGKKPVAGTPEARLTCFGALEKAGGAPLGPEIGGMTNSQSFGRAEPTRREGKPDRIHYSACYSAPVQSKGGSNDFTAREGLGGAAVRIRAGISRKALENARGRKLW